MNESHRPERPQVSLIIPCFNEEQRLPATLDRVVRYLEARGATWEILVVDDGSTDRTAEVARTRAAGDGRIRVFRYEPNCGKGYAVAFGARRARGEWILFSDADLSTPIEELEKCAEALARGADVAIGSRALPDSRLEVRQPWWRERAGRAMNFLIRRVSGLPFTDTQCGFKLFTRQAAQDIFPNLRVRGWMFDVEILVLARKLGYRVAEVPVTWINSEQSRVRLSHAPRILAELLHIRLWWLRRQPERCRREETEVAAQPSP